MVSILQWARLEIWMRHVAAWVDKAWCTTMLSQSYVETGSGIVISWFLNVTSRLYRYATFVMPQAKSDPISTLSKDATLLLKTYKVHPACMDILRYSKFDEFTNFPRLTAPQFVLHSLHNYINPLCVPCLNEPMLCVEWTWWALKLRLSLAGITQWSSSAVSWFIMSFVSKLTEIER